MPDTKQESPMAVVTAVPVMEMTRENVPNPGTAQWKNGVCGCCDHKGTNGEEAIEFLLKSTVVLTIFFNIFSFTPVLFVLLKQFFYSFFVSHCIVYCAIYHDRDFGTASYVLSPFNTHNHPLQCINKYTCRLWCTVLLPIFLL